MTRCRNTHECAHGAEAGSEQVFLDAELGQITAERSLGHLFVAADGLAVVSKFGVKISGILETSIGGAARDISRKLMLR